MDGFKRRASEGEVSKVLVPPRCIAREMRCYLNSPSSFSLPLPLPPSLLSTPGSSVQEFLPFHFTQVEFVIFSTSQVRGREWLIPKLREGRVTLSLCFGREVLPPTEEVGSKGESEEEIERERE